MGKHRIEIITSGGKDVINIEGCKTVCRYTAEEITVELYDRLFTVFGRSLNMPVLVNGNLCIKGYVKSFELKPTEEKRGRK